MIYLTNIDMSQNQIMNAVIQPLAVAPSNPKLGQIYTNSATSRIMWYNGTEWKVVGVVVESSETNGNIVVDGVEMSVYTLPAATTSTIGGIKVGTNLTVTADGTLSSKDTKVTNVTSNAGKVVTGLTGNTTLQTTNVKDLELDGITPVDGGYIADGATLGAAITALDAAVKNAVAGGGEVNQNAFSNVKVGTTTVVADSKTDTLELEAGNNISITADATNDKVTINATYNEATTSTAGLMSASDKTKLNGITAGAEPNVNADWNATSGDAQILNKPTKLSQFTNDEGFIDNTVSNLVNYYVKTDVFTKTEVNNLIGNIATITISVVDSLPSSGQSNVIYLKAKSVADGTTNIYDEYLWTGTAFERIGDTTIDLSNYLTKTGDASDVTVAFTSSSNRILPATGEALDIIVGKVIKYLSDLKTVAFTGSYNDLTNKPTQVVKYATGTLTAGSTTATVSYTGTFVGASVIDASTGEKVAVDVDTSTNKATINIAQAYSNNLTIMIMYS